MKGTEMKIYRVTDKEFEKYGKVINLDTKEILDTAKAIEYPDESSVYRASVEEFEQLSIKDEIENTVFGAIPSQLGYCYGHNDTLNALEWHKCSEVNIATADLILLLGDVRDIEDGARYDSAKVEAFKLLAGEAIEVYATTLHFCPIEAHKSGFGCVVGLLKDTNTPLENEACDKLLFRKNKWLIAHVENKGLIDRGAVPGIYGENYRIEAE